MSIEVGRPTISVTDSAVAKLKEMLAEQDDPNLCFRVFIQPGGCDGFSYGMTFDSLEADDEVIEGAGCACSSTRRARGCCGGQRLTM